MACEDFPCCGHERGCCPDFDGSGKQLNMICVCGKKLPIDNRSSLCDTCLRNPDDDDFRPDDRDDEVCREPGYFDDEDDYYEEGDNLVWNGNEEYAEEDHQEWE